MQRPLFAIFFAALGLVFFTPAALAQTADSQPEPAADAPADGASDAQATDPQPADSPEDAAAPADGDATTETEGDGAQADDTQADATPGDIPPQDDDPTAVDDVAEPVSEPQPKPTSTQPAKPDNSQTYRPDSGMDHHQRQPVQGGAPEVRPVPQTGADPLEGVGGDGQVVLRVHEPDPPTLFINPELTLGGMFSNYRQLGYFTYVAFGGGVGLTYNEDWHFRLNVWALGEPHPHRPQTAVTSGAPVVVEEQHTLWFVQPAAYVMYNIGRYPDYHYFVPMDLYLGVKLGANLFIPDENFGQVKAENNFLWGVALYPRFYLYKRAFGLAPSVEVGTIDYFRNFFLHYGVTLFWDFEAIGAPDPEADMY